MADQDGLRRADLLQESLQVIGEGRNTESRRRRRSAIARHVPGNGAITIAERFELTAPRPRRAADSVQEHQRLQRGVAGGLITEPAVPGFHEREMRHVRPPACRTCPMLTGPQSMKSGNFMFKPISTKVNA